jgi:nitroreductase
VVLGPRARQRYGEVKAALRTREIADAQMAREKSEKILADTAAVPCVIVATQRVDADPVREREDYAAIFMAIENMLLAATSMGLGSKIHTGDILDALEMQQLVQAESDERLVAIVHLGEPAEPMKPKERLPAEEKSRWLP